MPTPASEPLNARNRVEMERFEIETRPHNNSQSVSITSISKKVGLGFAVLIFCGMTALGMTQVFIYIFEQHFSDHKTSNGITTSTNRISFSTKSSNLPFSTKKPIFATTTPRIPPSSWAPKVPCTTRIVGFYDAYNSHIITDSQLQKLTHVVFAYMELSSKGSINFRNYQSKKKFEDLVRRAKKINPKIKLMVSIGGDDTFDYFPSVVSSAGNRRNLANSISDFLQTHQIHGVDLFWKWPQKIEHREQFLLLLQEIRQKLTEIGNPNDPYLLTVVTLKFDWAFYKETIDLKGILDYVDFINVNSLKYYGFWTTEWGAYTGPPAPLYSGIGHYENSNVDWTMNYVTCTTGDPRRLNLGVPFYGSYWRNVEGPIGVKEEMWFTAESRTHGEFDFDGGYIAWRDLVSNGWNVTNATWHQETRTSFIWVPEERKFLGFENGRSLREKTNYAKDKNFGGITIWSVEIDDDVDTLLDSVYSVDLCLNDDNDDVKYDCDKV